MQELIKSLNVVQKHVQILFLSFLTGPSDVDVPDGGLLVEGVDLLQLLVAQGLGHLVGDIVDGSLEIFIDAHVDARRRKIGIGMKLGHKLTH